MKIFLYFGSLLLGIASYSQSSKDEILYEKASVIFEMLGEIYNEHYIEIKDDSTYQMMSKVMAGHAEEYLNEIIEKYPESIYYSDALFARAQNLEFYGKIDLAKKSYIELLERNDVGLRKSYFANLSLASIEIDEGNFEVALSYIKESQNFPIRSFCGTEEATLKKRTENLLNLCYKGLEEK